MKTKKYLSVVLKYSNKKHKFTISRVLGISDTEKEALKLCKYKYSDIIEVWGNF